MKTSVKKIAPIVVLAALSNIIIFFGCSPEPPENPEVKPEMLIYTGITIIKPMLEIAREIEAGENVHIIITKGGSGNLMKSFLYNRTGDLYLPGSKKYYQILAEQHPDVILETVTVGHNKAAVMVQKGNPKKITSDLQNFSRSTYAVAIGNPDSGSIGKETKKIFQKFGLYEAVLQNAMILTTDSKDLVKLLVNKEADLVMNWYAVSTWPENRDRLEVLELSPGIAEHNPLVLGLLKYSRNKAVARKFMAYASSEKGKTIFKKHGLYFEQF